MNENKISKRTSAFNSLLKFIFSSHNYKYSDTEKFIFSYENLSKQLRELFYSYDPKFYFFLVFLNKRNKICYYLREHISKIKNITEIDEIYKKKILDKNNFTDSFKDDIIKEVRLEELTFNYILENLCISDSHELDSNFYLVSKRNIIKIFCDETEIFKFLEFKTRITLWDNTYDIYNFLNDLVKLDYKKFESKYFREKKKLIKEKEKSLEKIKTIFQNELELMKE